MAAGRGAAARNANLQNMKRKVAATEPPPKRYPGDEPARKAVALPGTEKVRCGMSDQLTDVEVQELTYALAGAVGSDGGGTVTTHSLCGYFESIWSCIGTEDVPALVAMCGGDISHPYRQLQVDDVQQGLRSEELAQLARGIFVEERSLSRDEGPPELWKDIERQFMVTRMGALVDRNDAFNSLPMTTFYLLVFLLLCSLHLFVSERHQLEKGIEVYMNGFGATFAGPFPSNIADVHSFWNWLEESGADAIFSDTRGSWADGTQVSRIAVASEVIGDALVSYELKDGTYDEIWLRHSLSDSVASTQASLAEEAKAAAEALKLSGWIPVDEEVFRIDVQFATYNARAKLFSKVRVTLFGGPYGAARPEVSAVALVTKPYSHHLIAGGLVDVLFFLLIAWMTFHETKDLVSFSRLGCSGFLNYWSFWNVVDWISITLGFLGASTWCMCVLAMEADAIQDLLDDDGQLKPGVSNLSSSALARVRDDLDRIDAVFMALHYIAASNTVSIVLRFFKGFQSNDRLKVVTRTFWVSYEDIVHFLLVFCIIFCCFATIGHVLFGKDLVEFYTIGSSMNTGLTLLFGDFGWYVHECKSQHTLLSSGMPRIFMNLWFLLFAVLISLVMLNMLLGIILDRHTEVVQQSRQNTDLPTILQQCRDHVQFVKQTWGHIPLTRLRAELDNEELACHPDPLVSEQTLLNTFDGMQESQAVWLTRWLEEALGKDFVGMVDGGARAKRLEVNLANLAEGIAVLGKDVDKSAARLSRLSGKLSGDRMEDVSPKQRSDSAAQTHPDFRFTGLAAVVDVNPPITPHVPGAFGEADTRECSSPIDVPVMEEGDRTVRPTPKKTFCCQ